MILNHVSVGTNDFPSAVQFYDAVMTALNVPRAHFIDGVAAAYGDNFEFWIGCACDTKHKASAGNGTHVAFSANSQEMVDEFYRTALEQGGKCGGKPGSRPEYGERYYAAFVFDLDGNKIEAVYA